MNQDVIDIVVPNVKKLISLDKMDEAINLLEKEISPLSDDLQTHVIMIRGSKNELQGRRIEGVLTDEAYIVERAKLKRRILNILEVIPGEIEAIKLTSSFKALYTTTTKDDLEKIQGPTNTLMPISWVYKAIEVSKSVCQVVREDGIKGTGWLLEGGWVMTNHHVIPNKDYARSAKLVFDYEKDLHGSKRITTEFKLDPDTGLFSNLLKLDYAFFKVLDSAENPISNWGYLNLLDEETSEKPKKGDFVNIIQHPLGQDKKIALTRNDVINIENHKIFYRTDTEKGVKWSTSF